MTVPVVVDIVLIPLCTQLYRLGFGTSATLTKKPSPADNSVICIFVIGGIGYNEVAQVQRLLDDYRRSTSSTGSGGGGVGENLTVLLGSTCFMSPADMFRCTFIDVL